MEPRIYTYKITFPNQGWWYWGWHKERKYGEDYSGTPKTHRQKWEDFEWEIQILELFDCEVEAQEVENRLIKPDLNNPNCLNEHYGSILSFEATSAGGKNCPRETQVKNGIRESRRRKESGQPQFLGLTLEEKQTLGRKVGEYSWKNKTGSFTPEITEQRHNKLREMNKTKWRCLVTGFVTSPGPLSRYQKARGIDTSLREKVE